MIVSAARGGVFTSRHGQRGDDAEEESISISAFSAARRLQNPVAACNENLCWATRRVQDMIHS